MTSLEETTKKHFMFPYDPDFVEEMSRPGFDAHLDLAKHANAVTQEEIDQFQKLKKLETLDGWREEMYLRLSLIRSEYKTANYACVYGVGAPKLGRETGLGTLRAQELIDAYWRRNWAVRALSDDLEKTNIKYIGKEMWLLNPVSGFYYSLRFKKDIFSTLNQSTGVYCFDLWVREILKVREQLTAQFHDEIVLEIKEGMEENCRKLLKSSIEKVNNKLKLNVQLDVDVQFGKNYAEIH